ncbi:MAG: hypothetical protein N2595_00185 [bacterium]|nr:hypothetical protein [bacterium]
MNFLWRWWGVPTSAFTPPTPWVDFHCHVIPQVDDGPRSMQDAVAMATYAAKIKITHIVSTVHYSDRYAVQHDIVTSQLSALRAHLQENATNVQVIAGREVTLTDQHVRDLVAHNSLRIDGSGIALVEFPEGLNRTAIAEGCAALLAAGIRPVIAHPERNFMVQEAPELLADLRLRGVLVQVNACSALGAYGAAAKRTVWHLLEHQWVDLLSSDAHSLHDLVAYVKACATIMRTFGAAFVSELISTTPARLLQGLVTSQQ